MAVQLKVLRLQISKSKEYVDSKFSTISGHIQYIKQHSSTEISRLSATLGDLLAKLVLGTLDSTSPAFPVRSEVVQPVDGVTRTERRMCTLFSVTS